MERINIDTLPETNVDWYANGELATDLVLNRPIKQVAGIVNEVIDAVDTKVDKVAGKQLSTEDFTSAEKDKLDGIQAGAQVNTVTSVAGKTGNVTLTKADVDLSSVDNTSDANKPVSTATQTALNNKVDKVAGYGLSQENFTPEEKTKLAGLGSSRWKGQFVSEAALNTAFPTTEPGSYADVDPGAEEDVVRYIWDTSDGKWVKQSGVVTSLTSSQVKQLYEANADTNAFTDTEKSKLSGIAAGSQVNTVTSVAGKTGAVALAKADVGLDSVDNTSDANKPVSTAVQTALDNKVDKVNGKGLSTEDFTNAEKTKLTGIATGAQVNTVTSVAGREGEIILTKDDVGLGSVDNTSDANKPVSTAVQTALDNKVDKVTGKQLSTEDYTTSDRNKLNTIQEGAEVNPIPVINLASTDNTLPLAASQGKVLKGFIDQINQLLQSDDTTLDNLQEIVDFVKLNRAELNALGIDNIAGLRTALDGKQPISSILTGTTASFTSASKDKLDTIATQATKNETDTFLLNRANHTGTQPASTITGLTKASVGLGSVDNTSDADKPVSTAVQTALDAKVDKVTGKQLSTEDYTTAEKTKLAGIDTGANNYTHPANHPASIITQDANNRFVTDAEKAAWNAKQETLVSGINIKTLNGESLLGGGNLVVSGSGASISNYLYENRATLRTLAANAGDLVLVDGLGLFIFAAGSDEPDDDESCFATATGRWLLQCPSWDLVDAWQLPEVEEHAAYDEDEVLRFASSFASSFASKVLSGTATCAITAVAASSSASFTGTVIGASVGDRVIATPPAALGSTAVFTGRLGYYAWVSAADTVTVMLTNSAAANTSTNAAIHAAWPITIIKS
jgi:hypothetical protein